MVQFFKSYSILIYLISLLAQPTWAMNSPDILYQSGFSCPTAHSEYKVALAELKSLKAKLEELECKDKEVGKELQGLIGLVGDQRENFLNIISLNNNKKLSSEDADFVRNYSESVAKKVSSLITITNSLPSRLGFLKMGHTCAMNDDDKSAVLTEASSMVHEASQLLSKVAGPYGIPISIGGNILSGVLKGIGTHMTNGAGKINFKDEKKRIFFAETLCLYTHYDYEVRQLMSPEGHLKYLRKAEALLIAQLKGLVFECKECKEIISNFQPNTSKNVSTVPIQDSDSPEAERPWATGLEILGETASPLVHTENLKVQETSKALDALAWVQREQQRFISIINFPTKGLEQAEVQSLRTRILQFMKTSGGEFLKWFRYNEIPAKQARLKKTVKGLKISMDYSKSEDISLSELHELNLPREFAKMVFYKKNMDYLKFSSRTFDDLQWAFEDFKALELRLENFDEYCEFFEASLIYGHQIEKQCRTVKSNSKVRLAKTYLAQTSVALAPFIFHKAFPKHLGPHDLSPNFYAHYLDPSIEFSPFIDTDFPEVNSQGNISFSRLNRGRKDIPFQNWHEQLDHEIIQWNNNHDYQL